MILSCVGKSNAAGEVRSYTLYFPMHRTQASVAVYLGGPWDAPGTNPRF